MLEHFNVNQHFTHVSQIYFENSKSIFLSLDVTPTVNPQLTKFCTNLTGITQDMVTNQPILEDVLKNFNTWLVNENLLDPKVKFIFVTCGDWDLYTMLPSQCTHFHLPIPKYFNQWINIKKSFNKVTGKYSRGGMMEMLKDLNIPHTGRHHSGIDDCKNIAEILKGLAERGYVFQENRKK
jgi:ERI1 exoribonuclease 3